MLFVQYNAEFCKLTCEYLRVAFTHKFLPSNDLGNLAVAILFNSCYSYFDVADHLYNGEENSVQSPLVTCANIFSFVHGSLSPVNPWGHPSVISGITVFSSIHSNFFYLFFWLFLIFGFGTCN